MANVAWLENGKFQYAKSVNTPEYAKRDSAIVSPIIPKDIEYKYLTIKGGQVVEMSQIEKDAIDAPDIAVQAAEDTLRNNIKTKLSLTDKELDYLRSM